MIEQGVETERLSPWLKRRQTGSEVAYICLPENRTGYFAVMAVICLVMFYYFYNGVLEPREYKRLLDTLFLASTPLLLIAFVWRWVWARFGSLWIIMGSELQRTRRLGEQSFSKRSWRWTELSKAIVKKTDGLTDPKPTEIEPKNFKVLVMLSRGTAELVRGLRQEDANRLAADINARIGKPAGAAA